MKGDDHAKFLRCFHIVSGYSVGMGEGPAQWLDVVLGIQVIEHIQLEGNFLGRMCVGVYRPAPLGCRSDDLLILFERPLFYFIGPRNQIV